MGATVPYACWSSASWDTRALLSVAGRQAVDMVTLSLQLAQAHIFLASPSLINTPALNTSIRCSAVMVVINMVTLTTPHVTMTPVVPQ